MTKATTLDVKKLNAALSGILSARAGHKVSVTIEKGGGKDEHSGKNLARPSA